MSLSFLSGTSPTIAQAAGWTMLHLLWVGAAIGGGAAILRRGLRSARPEARYRAALASLGSLAIAPAVLFASLYEPAATDSARPAPVASAPVTPLPRLSEDGERPALRVANPGFPALPGARRSWTEVVVPYLPWAWMAGSLATLSLLAAGLIGVEGLRRSSRPVPPGEVAALGRRLASSLGLAHEVAIAVCDRLASPVLIGVVRPMILLPPAALGGWSLAQVEMALLHELAHLRRRDNLVNLLQRLVESLLFFHPATWWLSGWVRLEREMCCDRLVVDRLPEPRLYAEMLVGLARPGRASYRAASAMADGATLTRIRRILDLEERSMKWTLPEGIGMGMAALVVAAMTMAAQAGPPKEARKAIDAQREMLRKVIARVERSPAPDRNGDSKTDTLVAMARAQLKIGARDEGLATLKTAFAAGDLAPQDNPGVVMERLSTLYLIAREQREAGDAEAARASLDRVTVIVEAIGKTPSDASKIAPIEEDKAGTMRVDQFGLGMVRAEGLAGIAEERLNLGDRAEALRLARLAIEAIAPEPAGLRGLIYCYLAGTLHQAGDPAGARDLIARARGLVDQAASTEEKEAIQSDIPRGLARIGDLDGALAAVANVGPKRQPRALDQLLETMTEPAPGSGAWYDGGGIKITIGADSFAVTDLAAARRDLSKIAAFVRGLDDLRLQARTLSKIAHLQAKAGDFAGATRTAEATPALKRSNFPGQADGFYDSVRPATFALVAREQAENGDRAGAESLFRVALAETQAITDEGEKVIASLVIARERARIGDRPAALQLLAEITPTAKDFAEPRRSRSLAMIVEYQIAAGDLAAATVTTEAIASFPKASKLRALQRIALAHRKLGDEAAARTIARQELGLLKAKAPEVAKPKPYRGPTTISADTFLDPDMEALSFFNDMHTKGQEAAIRAELDGVEAALQVIRAMPADHPEAVHQGVFTPRKSAYGSLVAMLAYRGDLAAAETVVDSIESPETRLWALTQIAQAIGNADRE